MADDKGRSFGEQAKQKGEEIKEDFKGGVRRVEGDLRNDEGLQREHDKSTLEKVGDSIMGACQTIGNKVHEGAYNIGLTNKEPEKETDNK